MIAILLLWLPLAAGAGDLRLATFHAELTRKGPGLLLRDFERGEDPQLLAFRRIVHRIDADILLLTQVDYDAEGRTQAALQSFLKRYPHAYAQPPNSLEFVRFDLDGNGKITGAGDRQAWAKYAGGGAMLLLSKHPVAAAGSYSLGDLLWRDLPSAQMPMKQGHAFPSARAHEMLRLVTQGLWVITIKPAQSQSVTVVAFQNTAPVFDGAEDFNGLRNSDQIRALSLVIGGHFGAFPTTRYALMGQSNLDPLRGDGLRGTMAGLLRDPRIQDAVPKGADGRAATVDFKDPFPGDLRLSYVLPSADWTITGSGVVWPDATDPLGDSARQASRHRLVWVDITPSP